MALNMRYKILLLDYKVKARLKTSLAFTIDFVCWILFSSYLKFKHTNTKFTVVEADKAHTLAMILILVIIIIRHRTPKCEVVEDQYLQEKLRSNKLAFTTYQNRKKKSDNYSFRISLCSQFGISFSVVWTVGAIPRVSHHISSPVHSFFTPFSQNWTLP